MGRAATSTWSLPYGCAGDRRVDLLSDHELHKTVVGEPRPQDVLIVLSSYDLRWPEHFALECLVPRMSALTAQALPGASGPSGNWAQ